MVSKNILSQYADLKREQEEVGQKIKKLEKEISRMEDQGAISEVITGGYGGTERFSVSGVPSKEYSRKKTLLYARKATLASLEWELSEMINEVEEFIASIDDSRMRRIIDLRYVQGLSWDQVGYRVGNLTKDSVRMAFERFIKTVD